MPQTDDWHNLYRESWKGAIIDEAFSHPAKFSRALIRAIYDHATAMEWLKPGDRVIDPFGGVALGALDAMRLGLHWVGVELEEKFVKLGWQNIALWSDQFRGILPIWGTATLLQGDSRRLCEVVGAASGCVSSPSYATGCSSQRNLLSPHFAEWRAMEGGFEGAISSPPFEASVARDVVDAEERVQRARELGISNAGLLTPIELEKLGKREQEYGQTEGQIGNSEGETFWQAARVIVEQVYQILVPGGVAIWVCKDFVRNKQRVPFTYQWAQLCEAVGFEWPHEHRCWVIEDNGTQLALIGEDLELIKEHKSFFRRLTEKKGSLRIDWESVLCMQKL